MHARPLPDDYSLLLHCKVRTSRLQKPKHRAPCSRRLPEIHAGTIRAYLRVTTWSNHKRRHYHSPIARLHMWHRVLPSSPTQRNKQLSQRSKRGVAKPEYTECPTKDICATTGNGVSECENMLRPNTTRQATSSEGAHQCSTQHRCFQSTTQTVQQR